MAGEATKALSPTQRRELINGNTTGTNTNPKVLHKGLDRRHCRDSRLLQVAVLMGSNCDFEAGMEQATAGCSLHVLWITEAQNVFCFTEVDFSDIILFLFYNGLV